MMTDSITDLKDLYGDDPDNLDKLHPDLKPWVHRGPVGDMLNHPLVQQMLPLWKPANLMYEEKKVRLAESEKEGNYMQSLWWYERPWRLPRLWAYYRDKQIDSTELHRLLSTMWVDSEHPSQFGKTFLQHLFKTAVAAGGLVTDVEGDPDEVSKMVLPLTTVTLFRGVSSKRDGRGLSWTKDGQRASWFATRLSKTGSGYVFGCEVEPSGIWGIFEGRGESEVVVNTRKIKNFRLLEEVEVEKKRRRGRRVGGGRHHTESQSQRN